MTGFYVHELGAAITREDVKNKAINLITPANPNFKGSNMWLKCFLNRHHLTLRKLDEKSKVQQEINEELSLKFIKAMRDTVKNLK